ncbi:MAG: hypothetical protein PVH61_26125 [Candidatus Aminicenantes bacterium]|jgi:hypothetical protein
MKNKGNILVSVVFVMFLAFVGISLLTFTVMHTKIVRARTMKLAKTDGIYQDLIYHLHHFREKVFNENIRDFNLPEHDYFNSTYFPDIITDNQHQMIHSFDYFEIPKAFYTKTRIIVAIEASSTTNSCCLNSEVFIDILSGKIPLTLFPFFMNTGTENPIPVDAETFLRENNVINKSDKKVVIDDIEAELSMHEFLIDALKITGTNLSWREIREKFGFPPSDEPIPPGIYFLVEDGILESIFIQGDIERMIFSARDQLQKIRLIKNTVPYELYYQPQESYFTCWDYSVTGEILYQEKIIVNGSVWSIEQEKDCAFAQGSDITLLVTNKAVIRSNLEAAEPYLSLQQSQLSNLKLVCGKEHLEHLFDCGSTESGVVIDNVDKTDPTNLRVSVIVDGKLTNKDPELKLSGSLYCKDLENTGAIEINHIDAAVPQKNYFSTVDFKYINQFLIHFIEEVYYD